MHGSMQRLERLIRVLGGLGVLCALGCPGGARRPSSLTVPASGDRVAAAVAQPNRSEGFCLTEGDGHNCVLAGPEVSAHVLATSGRRPRLVVAFPAGNAGAALWAAPVSDEPVRLTIAGPPTAARAGRLAGVRFVLQSTGALKVRELLTGSVRTLRDFNHQGNLDGFQRTVERAAAALGKLPPALRARLPRQIDAEELRRRARVRVSATSASPAILTAESTSLDGEHVVRLRVEGGRWDGRTRVLSAAAYPARFEVTALSSYTALRALPPRHLLNDAARARLRKLAPGPRKRRVQHSLRSLGFLATERKYLAGSWRFLTYFGRDTMMSLWLLLPALSPRAVETGLQSVLDRLSVDGRVAHEESVGDQGCLERLDRFADLVTRGEHDAALAELGQLSEPTYDYKMVDDDFMLAPLFAAHLADPALTAAAARRLADAPAAGGSTNLEALARNLEHLLAAAEPFARTGRALDLVALRPGQLVGDWRDSEEGLGGGRFPASVNVYLVPAALAALRRLLSDPKLPPGAIAAAAARLRLRRLAAAAGDARVVDRLIVRWRGAADIFRVRLDPGEVRRRLSAFLDSGATRRERALLLHVDLGGLTVAQLLAGGQRRLPAALGDGSMQFDALALDERGGQLQVMHTDDGFALLAADLPLATLDRLLRKYELPYPLGLVDRFGVYVASPALSARVSDFGTFDRGHYHGSVVWAWQLSLLQRGLMRQLRRWRGQAGEEARRMTRRLSGVVRRLAAAEARVGALAGSELWTVQAGADGFRPVAYGHAAGHVTESNALQLWSTVNLAVELERISLGLHGPAR